MEEVSRLDPIDGDDLGRTVLVDSDVFPRPAQDCERAFVGLLKRPLDSIHSDEHMGAVFEVLADESLGGIGAGLHRLKARHVLLEAAGEILSVAGS